MKRHTFGRSNTPCVKTSCMVLGERQIETFEAMCAIAGRKPYQLVADIVLDAIREAQADHDVQALVVHSRRFREQRQGRHRGGLSLVGDRRG